MLPESILRNFIIMVIRKNKKLFKDVLVLASIFLLSVNIYSADNSRKNFPLPKKLELRVQFWINIFTIYSVDEWVIHDSGKPERIYSVISFKGRNLSRKERYLLAKKEKHRISLLLKKLSSRKLKYKSLPNEERRLFSLFGKNPDRKRLYKASEMVRVQQGMRETFRNGIKRSGAYVGIFKKIFADSGLPEDLVYLPHVESSFNPKARSRTGAKGMWQFTRSTGRRFLLINRVLDERADPFLSAGAAAKYLKECYEELGSWPLAVTAYNHGLSGVKRAAVSTGSDDIVRIVTLYKSRRFGFASKNFYAEFLAACHVAENSSRYFPDINPEPLLRFREYTLKKSTPLDSVISVFNLSAEVVKRYNPALKEKVFSGGYSLPSGYALRLPVYKKMGREISAYNEKLLSENSKKEGISLPEVVMQAVKAAFDFVRVEDVKTLNKSLSQSDRDMSEGSSLNNNSIEVADGFVKPVSDFSLSLSLLSADYLKGMLSVKSGYLIVYPAETLGHYADWLKVPTWRLRLINKLQYGQNIRTGQKIKLIFKRISRKDFEKKRMAYHKTLMKKYFYSYTVRDSLFYKIRSGDTLWNVANKRFDVPVWLILAFNPEKNLSRIRPGDVLKIPVVRKKQSAICILDSRSLND